jgi:hypothetical protein
MKGHGDQGGGLAWRRTDARTSEEEEAQNKKIAAGCNRGPRLLLCGLSFRKSRERKEGRRDGGREGWRDSSPSSDDAFLHHHLAIAVSFKYGPSTNKAKKKKNSITCF